MPVVGEKKMPAPVGGASAAGGYDQPTAGATPVSWKVARTNDFVLAEFTIEGGVIQPSDLSSVQLPIQPEEEGHLGLVISGRGPVWLYAYLVHQAHPFAWVATYDPRLQGAVVVASHVEGVKEGDVVPVDYTSLSFS